MTSNRIIEITEAAPGPDLRANAFVGAWERIEAAQKLKIDHKKRIVEPLPELYWATIAEAAVLAQLARADEDPGREAGRYVVDRHRRIEEDRARMVGAFERAKARRPERIPKPNPTGGTDQGRGIPTFDNGWTTGPPFRKGHRVCVASEIHKYAGRTGLVTNVGAADAAGWIEVELDLLHFNDSPVTITVLADALEFESAAL